MPELNKNIVWLASYPKSGNTWCRIFLARYLYGIENINNISIPIYSSKSYLETDSDIDVSELPDSELHLLRLKIFEQQSKSRKEIFPVKIHDYYDKKQFNLSFLPLNPTKVAVYIVRNPFDLAISFSRHLGQSIEKTISIINNPDYKLSIPSKKFVSQLPQKLNTWSNHYKSWTEQNDIPVLVIKYEDLLEDPIGKFSEILNFIGIEVQKEKLNEAVRFSSFDNLQKQENQNGFEEKSVFSPTFFHTGKSGYFKNILNKSQINIIFENHSEIIHKLGYERFV